MKGFRELDQKFKKAQKRAYDKRHRVKTLPELPEQSPAWVEAQGSQAPGQVVGQDVAPRSYMYVVETQRGVVRRNTPSSTENTRPF